MMNAVQSGAAPPPKEPALWIYPIKNLGVAIIFWLFGLSGYVLSQASSGVTPIWSPMGIGVAIVILSGYRFWPGIYVGALMADLEISRNPALSFLLAGGKVMECLLAAWMVNRFANGRKFYLHPWDIVKFAVLAGMLCPLVSPPVGVQYPSLQHYIFWAGRAYSWLSCWLGEVVSVLVFTPLIVIWRDSPRHAWLRRQRLEYVLLLSLLILFGEVVFGDFLPPEARAYWMPNFCLPFLLWAAFRFGPRETIITTFVLGALALWGTFHGYGYFAKAQPAESLLVFQVFLAVNSILALLVAAIIVQRNQIREDLRQARDELEIRVQQRTNELSETNRLLEKEMVRRQQAQDAHSQALRRLVEVQEIERRRISHELHDRMGQELTAIKLSLKMLNKQTGMAESVQAGFHRLDGLADSLMVTVHRLAWELRPAILDDFGLDVALRRYVTEWAGQNGVQGDFHSDGMESVRLPAKVESMLYRITQEALTNISRHARAKRVSVLLERRHNQLSLIVEDDGCGFDAETVLKSTDVNMKLGLMGMQERVMLVGGTLEIESSPSQGTTLFVRVPLDARMVD
ncbi:MAG: MASE1 domain-containing protein [Verrucomicrobiota bacterium]